MQMFQKGRSMIEMLGVLAIIGVLSIGGIVLYRRAVNNHQANTILDDANRLAFVIMENDRAYETNDFVDEELIDSVTYTGTYNLDAFMAQAGQFGIVVTKVPKGVCEALIGKASIEYKVRVMPWSEEKYLVPQMANIGIIYDSFHKDICNDTNDVVLYFNDTSPYCNKPDEGEDYTKCLSNADCCGGSFCWFANNSDCKEAGIGQCKKVSDFVPSTATAATTTAAGKTWIRSTGMNWWSAQNWCQAQGRKPANRADIGCGDNLSSTYCTQSGTVLEAIQEKWGDYGKHWLEDYGNSCRAYRVGFDDSYVLANGRYGERHALCH